MSVSVPHMRLQTWYYLPRLNFDLFLHHKNKRCESMDPNCLQEIMNKKRITYRKLEFMTGVSRSTLHRIANYELSPTQDAMISIARGLKMKVTDIFYFDY